MRASYRKLKAFHLFLNDFGSSLAVMPPLSAEVMPTGSGDLTTPRMAARIGEHGGVSNFSTITCAIIRCQSRESAGAGEVGGRDDDLAAQAVSVAPEQYFIWPLNLDMDGALLKYATAQLVCRVETEGDLYYFLFALPGIEAEFAFDETTVSSVHSELGAVTRGDGRVYLENQKPGTLSVATVASKTGKTVHVVVLTAEQAENIWKAKLGGRDRVVLSGADIFFDGDTIDLRSRDTKKMAFSRFSGF